MSNSISTITKYLSKTVDTVFATESKTAVLENGSKFINIDVANAREVRIADILMDGLSDYYRANTKGAGGGRSNYNGAGHADGYKVGSARLQWTTYSLTQDRGKQFQIDEMDDEEAAGLVIANLLTEFLRRQVVPEVDAYRFSTIAGRAYSTLGNKVTETPVTTKGDASEITHLFNKAFEWLSDHEVPSDEQVIFVSTEINTTLKNTEEIYKHLTQVEYTSERGVTFKLSAYEGRPIIEVPSSRFIEKIVTGDGGWSPAEGAHALNYIVCSTRAVLPVVKLAKSQIFGPSEVQDFDGYKVNFRLYHDCFIPKNKILGAYVSVSATEASAKTSVLDVAIERESANTYKLVGAYTQPAGRLGTVIHGAVAYTLGATATDDQLATAIADGETFTTENASEYFALVDGDKNIVAVSQAVTLPTA